MLYLISSSNSRKALLKEAGIDFEQRIFDYDENISINLSPALYVQKVVSEKQKQFCTQVELKDSQLLFADSIVSVYDQILTKPKNATQALEMLKLQSNNIVSVWSAFLLTSAFKTIFSLSKTSFIFKEFDPKDLSTYIQSGLYQGKAGALMCEGFHKKYIIKQVGNLSTALGLDTQSLKAYL